MQLRTLRFIHYSADRSIFINTVSTMAEDYEDKSVRSDQRSRMGHGLSVQFSQAVPHPTLRRKYPGSALVNAHTNPVDDRSSRGEQFHLVGQALMIFCLDKWIEAAASHYQSIWFFSRSRLQIYMVQLAVSISTPLYPLHALKAVYELRS